jgi:hypothetical protein
MRLLGAVPKGECQRYWYNNHYNKHWMLSIKVSVSIRWSSLSNLAAGKPNGPASQQPFHMVKST